MQALSTLLKDEMEPLTGNTCILKLKQYCFFENVWLHDVLQLMS